MNYRKARVAVILMALAVSATSSAGAEAKVKLKFWHPHPGGSSEFTAMAKISEAYNKSQNRVEVSPEFASADGVAQTKLLTAIAAGASPDVAGFADLLVAGWAESGMLTPLDTYAKASGIGERDFWKASWNVCRYKGKQWAIPLSNACRALYYNKALFASNGLDPASPPKTLEALEVYAAKIFKPDGDKPKYSKVGFVPFDGNWFLYGWGWLFGGEFYNAETKKITANDPQIVAAMEWVDSYVKRYDMKKLTPSPRDWATGNLGMLIEGSWNLSYFEKLRSKVDYGVAPVPAPEGRETSTWAGVWTLVIPKGSKHPKDAWDFIKFATGPVGQRIFADVTSSSPALKKVAHQVIPAQGPEAVIFMNLMDYSKYRPSIPVQDIYWAGQEKAMSDIVLGKRSPRQALDLLTADVQKAFDKVLARVRK